MLVPIALAAAPSPPDPGDRAPLAPFGVAKAGHAVRWRVQQHLVQGRDVTVDLQAEVVARVEAREADGTLRWSSTTAPLALAAWTEFGRVPDEELVGKVEAPAVTWRERPDGTRSDVAVEGGGVANVLGDVLTAVRVPRPERAVPVGGTWGTTQAVELAIPVEDRTLALHLDVSATYTHLGWARIGDERVAVIDADVRIDGWAQIEATRMDLAATSAASVWLDPATGEAVYLLQTAKVTQRVGDRDRPTRTELRVAMARR